MNTNEAAPLVSVVLCTHDQREFLRDAVESVLRQTYTHVELVLIDNGSRDGTDELLEEWRPDPRVRIFRFAENESLSKRMNAGVAASAGAYISFLYGDDYYLETKIERQLEVFTTGGRAVDVVYSSGLREDARTKARWLAPSPTASGLILPNLIRELPRRAINPIAPLVRRACLERYPHYEDVFVEGESIYLRLALTCRFRYLDEPLVVMREHERNMGKVLKRNSDIFMLMLERLERSPDFPASLGPELNGARARLMRTLAWQAARLASDSGWARECLRSAARWRSRELVHPRAIGAAILSLLPAPALRAANAAITRLRRARGYPTFRSDYA